VKSFKKFINELNTSGSGGVFGVYNSTDLSNKDSYASGTTVIPKILGTYTRQGKLKKRKNKWKKDTG
jgi:hypothetical protein